MAEPIANEIASGVTSSASQLLPPELIAKISLVTGITQVIAILVIIYFTILIIEKIFNAFSQRKLFQALNKIVVNLEEINSKLSKKK
ncbi:hypothetical protein J4402_00990 [Candidatus Pacearchaeota archaeon]|nr:hypothetical protein [Candidatus Pacearchaeota archaeon]